MSSNKYYNLIIGLAGPYGAGCSSIAEDLTNIIQNRPGCTVVNIRVSELIKRYYKIITARDLKLKSKTKANRRKILQEAGTEMRQEDPEIIGKVIITEIYEKALSKEEKGQFDIGTAVFIVDSIKNQNELELLRKTFSNEFFLLFLYSDRETRWRRMVDYKSWDKKDRVKFEERDLIDQDEKSERPSVGYAGQQVGKLAGMGDYYIVNDQNRESLYNDAKRFVNLLFGGGSNQPTLEERSMHLAFSAANRSFCLSRQVGAAIIDDKGDVLGVGHNDVPKATGGLYRQEDENDRRCYLVGDMRCINHVNKEERFNSLYKKIINEIQKYIGPLKSKPKNGSRSLSNFKESIKSLIEGSPFREATEYCRAVHAEMEALLSVARTGRSPVGATMYVTTEPCHNCTKHIICAGIKKVVFMEPYPKSLGMELHSDAIHRGSSLPMCSDNKVLYTAYQGVAPYRYQDFFQAIEERKDNNGKYIRRTKDQKSFEPRFAMRLNRRKRKVRPKDLDAITAREKDIANSIGYMLNNGRTIKKHKMEDDKDAGGKATGGVESRT